VQPLSTTTGVDLERYNPFAAVVGPHGQTIPGGFDLGIGPGGGVNLDPQALGREVDSQSAPLGLLGLLGFNQLNVLPGSLRLQRLELSGIGHLEMPAPRVIAAGEVAVLTVPGFQTP
jgi:hypothetical protein